MNTPKSIHYAPAFSEEDLGRRIANLSDAIGKALEPLHYWEDHEQSGANDIADNEAKFVQEILGFLYLLELAQEEEPGAIKSVNKACWEIEMARQIGGIEVNHPWEGEANGRFYETHCSSEFEGFDYSDYALTPEDNASQEASCGETVNRNREMDPTDSWAEF